MLGSRDLKESILPKLNIPSVKVISSITYFIRVGN